MNTLMSCWLVQHPVFDKKHSGFRTSRNDNTMNFDQIPIQYQRGFTEFYKLKFLVNKDVLIPRPETELLVEQVIKANPLSVLEIGTGTGCIAISIAKNVPLCKITAVDISKDALDVAQKNAKLNHVEKQITFKESDLLSGIVIPSEVEGSLHSGRDDKRYDWIVANLPYIPSSRIQTLDTSVKDFEPHIALDGGEDGFELYRRLFIEMLQKNIYPLYFIGEIDTEHADVAKKEAERLFPRAFIEIKKDLTKRPRFLIINF